MDHVKNPEIAGYVSNGSNEEMIVIYRSQKPGYTFDTEYYYVIPFENGEACAPFSYQGKERSPEAIYHDLAKDQLNEIMNFNFSEDSYKQGKIYKKNLGIFNKELDKYNIYSRGLHVVSKQIDGVSILPYIWTYGGININDYPRGLIKEGLYDPRAKILILPERQKRVKSEKRWAIVKAVLNTPATMVTDLLLVPMWLLSSQ